MLNRRFMIVMTCFVAMTVLMSGCEPLRKKFTRKKKRDQVEEGGMIPVLEPEEYPTPEDNPVENYKQHFVLTQVFYKELWRGVSEDMTTKNIKFTMNQVVAHLQEMKKMLVKEKQQEIAKLEGYLSYYQESLNQDMAFRNRSRIESDLRAFHRQLIKCKADQLKGSFISSVPHDKSH